MLLLPLSRVFSCKYNEVFVLDGLVYNVIFLILNLFKKFFVKKNAKSIL